MTSTVISSPIGALELTCTGDALTRIDFAGDTPAGAPPTDPLMREVAAQLEAYFAGGLSRFDLPLAPAGTPFQRRVWDALTRIPYARTTSYGELAARIGTPTASRAVGAANGRNPIPVVIPCHRVVGSNGRLTGYGGGLNKKAVLLDLEANHLAVGGLEPGGPARR